MNQPDLERLVTALDTAVEILNRHRTAEPTHVAAYDTLKQARAMALRAVQSSLRVEGREPQLAAA